MKTPIIRNLGWLYWGTLTGAKKVTLHIDKRINSEEWVDKSTLMIGYFDTPLSVTEKKIIKDIVDLNINRLAHTDVHRAAYPTRAE